MRKSSAHFHTGFSIVELIVSVAIFVLMTSLLVTKYGTFNQNILITNNAYDVALILRNAQSYGLNVKSTPVEGGAQYSGTFTSGYGVYIKAAAAGTVTEIPFFPDVDRDGIWDGPPENPVEKPVATYALKNQITFTGIKAGSSPDSNSPMYSLDITFRRPNPDAIIMGTPTVGGTPVQYSYAEFTLVSNNGATRKIAVRSTGQISVMTK